VAETNFKPGWKVWRFDQIATNVNVRIDNPSESGMEYYVGLEHLDPDSLRIRRWGSPDDVEATKLCFKSGDIIFGRRRAYQRKLGVAEFDGICSAHAMVLRAKPEVVLPEFLPFFMQSDLFMNRAVEISVGSLSPTINWKTLAIQEFALPPMDEQRRITLAVNAVDEVLESSLSVLCAAEAARLSFLTECFPEQLEARGLLTRDGAICSLSELADIRTGLALGKKNDGTSVTERPYLRVANVQDGVLDLAEIKTVQIRVEDVSRYLLMPGDVLMNEGGDYDKLGRGAVWQGEIADCLHQNHVFAVRPNQSVLRSAYLAALGRSPHGKRYFRSCAKRTSNLASINKKQLSAFPVVLVPTNIQDQIVEQVSGYDETEARIRARLAGTQQLRSQLLKQVFGAIA
jgi:restriction endonuclease S subunit